MQKKVMNINSYDDGASLWRVACDCCEPNHDVILWFDIDDKEIPWLNLNLSVEVGAYNKWHDPFHKRWWWRIKSAAKILFTGHYTMQGDVILDRDGITAMQTALQKGVEHVDACDEYWKNKNSKK